MIVRFDSSFSGNIRNSISQSYIQRSSESVYHYQANTATNDWEGCNIEQNMALAHRTGIINFDLFIIRRTCCMLVLWLIFRLKLVVEAIPAGISEAHELCAGIENHWSNTSIGMLQEYWLIITASSKGC